MKIGDFMQEKLKKLSKLYNDLLVCQKRYDAARTWCLYYQYSQPDLPALVTLKQDILNVQNEIDNVLADATNKHGDEFMGALEKIIFPCTQMKVV